MRCEDCTHFTKEEDSWLEEFCGKENIPPNVFVVGCDLEDVYELDDDDWGMFVYYQLHEDENCPAFERKVKQRIVNVILDSCEGCPYLRNYNSGMDDIELPDWRCANKMHLPITYKNEFIVNYKGEIRGFPDWCPLDYYEK